MNVRFLKAFFIHQSVAALLSSLLKKEMFGRCCFSIALILMVFALSSNAIQYKQCRKYQIKENGDLKGTENTTEKCIGCSGYICKTSNGNYLRGGDCTDKVDDICKQGWSMVKIESIAEEPRFQADFGKYFVFSCPTVDCNDIFWLQNKMFEYKDAIKIAGLSIQPNSNKIETVGCDHMNQEKLNKLSGGLACLPGDLSFSKQFITCHSSGCKCWENENTEVQCDILPKLFAGDCDIVPYGVKREFPEEYVKYCSSANAIGYGFALLMAPLFAFLFLL